MSEKGRLIVLAAFDRNEDGELVPAFDPRQIDTEGKAIREAKFLADKHTSVVAWARDADAQIGEYGPSTVLFQKGELPDLD